MSDFAAEPKYAHLRLVLQNLLEKEAFQPMGAAGPTPPGQDPAQGGGMPPGASPPGMPPGGAPPGMDPSQGGGAPPPQDPSGGQDPNAGGQGGMPGGPVMLNMQDLVSLFQQVAGGGGAPPPGGAPPGAPPPPDGAPPGADPTAAAGGAAPAGGKKGKSGDIAELNAKVDSLSSDIQKLVAFMTGAQMGGGGGAPGGAPPGAEEEASPMGGPGPADAGGGAPPPPAAPPAAPPGAGGMVTQASLKPAVQKVAKVSTAAVLASAVANLRKGAKV